MSGACSLLLLPSSLLESIWPAERVVLGLRVCKKLREELQRHSSNVALVIKSHPEIWCQTRLVRDFSLLSHSRLEVSIQRKLQIGAVAAEVLATALRSCRKLAHLELSCNEIGAEGAGAMAGVLGECKPKLKSGGMIWEWREQGGWQGCWSGV